MAAPVLAHEADGEWGEFRHSWRGVSLRQGDTDQAHVKLNDTIHGFTKDWDDYALGLAIKARRSDTSDLADGWNAAFLDYLSRDGKRKAVFAFMLIDDSRVRDQLFPEGSARPYVETYGEAYKRFAERVSPPKPHGKLYLALNYDFGVDGEADELGLPWSPAKSWKWENHIYGPVDEDGHPVDPQPSHDAPHAAEGR
jgi:hypothetical protein